MRSRDKIVGVFDAGQNALKLREPADRIVFEPRRKLFGRDGGKYGHAVNSANG
jgi:hypothetical protein